MPFNEINIKQGKRKKIVIKLFIETNFIQYQLPDYTGIKELINLCAYHPKFYKILRNLLRSLFETL